MRYVVQSVLLLFLLVIPVRAVEYTAPLVPDSGQELMPAETSFSDGLMEMFRKAIHLVSPDFQSALKLGYACLGCVILISLIQLLGGDTKTPAQWVGVAAIAGLLLNNANAMIYLGSQTIMEISEYGKLLLPVMTAALAAQGGVGASGALYTGTMIFGTLLSNLLSQVLVPMVYVYLALSVSSAAIEQPLLKNVRDGIRGLCTWCLRTILIVFTTYMSVTGVVSGTTDAVALKATKVAISSVVPVVGNILSDASEAVLVSAALAKNAAGIYGIFAVLAVFLLPFLRIGVQYLVLKATAGICSVFECKAITGLIGDVSGAMGMLLAMTGSSCLLQLISTISFLKGVNL